MQIWGAKVGSKRGSMFDRRLKAFFTKQAFFRHFCFFLLCLGFRVGSKIGSNLFFIIFGLNFGFLFFGVLDFLGVFWEPSWAS